jgi:predicted urease superfamily metal-dependent hydrolase
MKANKSKAALSLHTSDVDLSGKAVKKILKRNGLTMQEVVKASRESSMNTIEYINFLDEF